MINKTYADDCLERAEGIKDHKLRVTAVIPKNGIGTAMSFYLRAVDDVPELARRLKRACGLLRALKCCHYDTEWLADELEAMPEKK